MRNLKKNKEGLPMRLNRSEGDKTLYEIVVVVIDCISYAIVGVLGTAVVGFGLTWLRHRFSN
tara:strand:- start:5610 stop:5795 length:186 start_codon:yes stop_codon:yes gene_type:complete